MLFIVEKVERKTWGIIRLSLGTDSAITLEESWRERISGLSQIILISKGKTRLARICRSAEKSY